MIAEVIVDITNSQVDKIFDYELIDESIKVGTRVLVPFGPRKIQGFVIKIKQSSNLDKSKIKPIIGAVDDFPCILPEMIEVMNFMIEKYHLKYIDALRLFIPAEMRTDKVRPLSKDFCKIHEFDYAEVKSKLRANAKKQLELLDYIKCGEVYEKTLLNEMFTPSAVSKFVELNIIEIQRENVDRKPLFKNVQNIKYKHTPLQEKAINTILSDNDTYLLFGVTGSGKTEVYMSVVEEVINKGQTAIMLVPEISLTPQVLGNFKNRFGDKVAILHSGLSAGERFDEWKRLMLGDAQIVVGARSAIFAPLTNVGVIIIDEEHETSYISESNPRYNTFDIAEFRKNYNNCSLVLASATPNIESFFKAQNKEYQLIELPVRVNGREMPKIQIVDMVSELRMGNSDMFSRTFIAELDKCMKEKRQAMVLINRRGYTSFMRCCNCGYIAKCSDCDVSLVYHKDEDKLKCHYCGKRFKALTKCPECGSEYIRQGAIGTQKVVDRLQSIFPDVKIVRMDNDNTRTKNAHQKLLEEFSSHKPSILVGTQMIAKGHDFKDVTLVGIIDADQSLYQTDYKSTEKTFQLVTQMSGRAGREEAEGKVILQTYAPRHYCYKFIANYNYKAFFDKELNIRKVTKFPPYSKIIRLLFTSINEESVREITRLCYNDIKQLKERCPQAFIYLDAMKSPISKIKNKVRYQILIRLNPVYADDIIKELFAICDKYENPKVSVFVETEPQNLS